MIVVIGKIHGGVIDSLRLRIINSLTDYAQDKLRQFGGYIKGNLLGSLKRLFYPLKYWIKSKYIKILEGIGNTLNLICIKYLLILHQFLIAHLVNF
jgi:hypothetical protein